MICKSGIRSLIVQAGNIVAFTKTGALLNNIGRLCMQASSGNCEFRMSSRMMADSSATEKRGSIVYVLSEKDEEGGCICGGWKSEGGKLSCGYSISEEKEPQWKIFLILILPRLMGKESPCLEFLMVNDAAFLDSKRDTYRDDGNHLYVANVGDSRTVIYQRQAKVFSINLLTAS